MQIQFNTDKTISGEERSAEYFSNLIAEDLSRFESFITRVEVYLTDENGEKEGPNDIQCKLEVRPKGKQPIAVSNQADTVKQAVEGALEKVKISLEKILGKSKTY